MRWQVRRVVDKISGLLPRTESEGVPGGGYEWLLLGGGDYELAYRDDCPEVYLNDKTFWIKTARTIIHDTETGEPARLSLALAIDMLMPCHWDFVENLRTVLSAIGGDLNPDKPYAACGRNIQRLPQRLRMKTIANTLRLFCGLEHQDEDIDRNFLSLLGGPTETKIWLARSLCKTICLQLNPPDSLRITSALSGPDWICYQSSEKSSG